MRQFITTLAVAVLLLLAAPAVAVEAGVEGTVAKKAAVLELLFRKAKKALVNAAQDKSFSQYFSVLPVDEKSRIKERIDQISLSVQSRFHVEEMCLINVEGAEISRIVGNRIAHDLDPDETGAIFFEPGFAQKPRKVYVSPAYISGDADIWVVAFVTPILAVDEKKAILHYEHPLTVYQEALNKDIGGDERFIVAVNADGWIVSDSRRRIPIEKRAALEAPRDYFEKFEFLGMNTGGIKNVIDGAGVLSADGESYTAAYKTVENWTLFVFERRKAVL